MIYNLTYDDIDIAKVEITDSYTSRLALKQMVEFWSGWEEDLEDHDGSYVDAWLSRLARYAFRFGKGPIDEEGWVPLDGTHHIWLRGVWRWEPDDDLFNVEEETT